MAFDAYWIPELEDWNTYDPAQAGARWLGRQQGPRAVLVPRVDSARTLDLPAGTAIITPRGHRSTRAAVTVLVCYPDYQLLDIAQGRALETVCVADDGTLPVSAWVKKHNARPLAPPDYDGEIRDLDLPDPPPEIEQDIDRLMTIFSNNSFMGTPGKEAAIRALRRIHQDNPNLHPDLLEAWAYTHPKATARRVAELRTLLHRIQRGHGFRDYRRRPI